MIRGYFSRMQRVPMVDALLTFDGYEAKSLSVSFVVDSGAHNLVLAPLDARRLEALLGISVNSLQPLPGGISGVGGSAPAWSMNAQVRLGGSVFPTTLVVMQPPPPVRTLLPSLNGPRDSPASGRPH